MRDQETVASQVAAAAQADLPPDVHQLADASGRFTP